MDDDESDDRMSLSEEPLPCSSATKVVVTLDYVEFEIEKCLQEKKQSLRKVIDELGKKLGRKLNELDCSHVEDKYIELLSNIWLDEGLYLVSSGFDPRHPFKYIEVLNAVNSFSDCCSLFGTSGTYNDLISDLPEISLSCKSREKELICELKKRCYNDILNRTGDTKNEMDFVNNCIEALKSSYNVHGLCRLLQVDHILKRADKVGLRFFLSYLLGIDFPCLKLGKLKKSANKIYNNKEYFFIEDLRDKILAYLKPVVIIESNSDGRQLLEVSGKHIVISKELEEIEKSPRFSHIEEVRFVGAGVIHIDADLSSSIWHGKNIAIYGETLIVSEDKCVTWDVSGKDADFTATSEAAGTSEDGCGLKGLDGEPGESGGNVCILVQSIENSMNFKIVSNGGKGSKGQNGGSGRDGKDGKHIDARKFKENFPPVSHLLDKNKNYMKTMDSVCESLLSVDKFHYGLNEFDSSTYTTDFKSLVKQNTDLLSVYFEITTEEGCKITFSFYNEPTFSCCQSFLLHKGALGTEGKVGGAGGCGGKGGFSGDVKVQTNKDMNFISSEMSNNGADGEIGKTGRTGNPGKSGLDGGYMDCTLALFHSLWNSVKWPKVFSPGPENSRLTVKFYSEKTPNRVKCPHNSLYAEVTPIKRTYYTAQLSTCVSSVDLLQKHQHQEMHAKRKKNISERSIVEQYKENDSIWNIYNIEDTLQKVQAEMEELINETPTETEKITQKTKVTRQISHCQNDWYSEEIKFDILLENKDSSTEIEDIAPSPSSSVEKSKVPELLSLFKLALRGDITNIATSIASVAQTMKKFETHNDSLKKFHLDKLEYLYVSFCLAQYLEKKQNIRPKSQLTNTKFLAESHNGESDVNKGPLHVIEQFFCEDSILCRQEVVRMCSDYSFNEEPLQEALKSFISEFKSERANTAFSELDKYQRDFNQLKERRLKEKLLPLIDELLSKSKNKNLYNYLLNGVLKQSTDSKFKFENEIAQDKFLSNLYKSFVVEMKKSCDWEMSNFESNVRLIFEEYMTEKGPLATSYREVLAQRYDVNILLYTQNKDDNRLVLVSNHNPKASSEIHLLLKRNKFVKLNFDYEFARLFEKYKHLGNALNKIMFHFCSFTDKKQISDYISNSPFTSDDYSGLAKSGVVGIKINHILNQDNYLNTISNSYMSQKDNSWVKCRLDKLKVEFIGYENILHYMSLHFEVEGAQITAMELCFVINQILKFATEESRVMSLVSWIIAAQPQQLWLLELALLKVELYLKSPLKHELKLKWREYIEDQAEKGRLMMFLKKLDCETCQISVDNMDELLNLMGNVPNAHCGLESVKLSEWKYYLKDRFWAHHMTSITDWSVEQLKTLSFYLVTLENAVGKGPCLKIIDILKEHSNEIKAQTDKEFILTLLNSLNSKEVCFSDRLWNMLSKTTINEWQKVIDMASINTASERTLQQLVKLMQNSNNTSKNVLNILPSIESTLNLANAESTKLKSGASEEKLKRFFSDLLDPNKGKKSVLLKIKSLLAKITPDESTFDKALQALYNIMTDSSTRLNCENLTKSLASSNVKEYRSNDDYMTDVCTQNTLLSLIELCIAVKKKIWLRQTQKLTVMTLLTNTKNTLAQVSTGEGKSLIVVTVAIMKALSNEKVNIVTSSKVLAKRDAEMYKDIYELCGLTVGHNCSENIEERKKVYSNCQVIYGDLLNFQRDYLLDRVYNKNILGDCSFETVIVDEVDSMLLDKGNNVLYLSHDIPGLDKIEPIFIYIWKWISRPIPSEQFEDLFNIQAIKDKIIYEIFGVINKEVMKQLDTSMTDKQVEGTWQYLIENEVIDHSGKILKESVIRCNVDSLPEDFIPKVHLKYLLERVINREKILNVPKYLHLFVEDHLESWIKSGISAMMMESGRDYIVDVDRSDTVSDRNPIITILDRDTGTDLINSQWDEALHQFLQLKHGCKLSLLNLKAVFISNVTYLKRYKTLYGLTGTLGSTRERELLQEVYDVDYVTIPTAKAKKFSEEPSILCSGTEEWKQSICVQICRITRNKRSALIICETIKDVELLREKLEPHFRRELIHLYTRDYESLNVTGGLQPGNIIVSTNLAGRGTDIKLSEQLIANGGLYVCLAFLPSNYRVEEQAYGRAARNGEPGTAQLIFRTTRLSASNTTAQIIDLKKQRDINERKRLADIKSYHETQIQHEENWFEKFKDAYKTLREMKQKQEIKDILLQAFLNEWAFWLDKNKKHLLLTENPQDICISLEHFISNWTKLESGDLKDWLEFITDPTQLVKLGLACLKIGEMPSSLISFDKVIKKEPYFSEIACYYRVCVKTKLKDLGSTDLVNTEILKPLKVTAKKLKERSESSYMSGLEINWLKEQDNFNVVQIDAFLDQQKSNSQVFEIFLQSIYSILGKEIHPEIFIIPGLIEKQLSKDIYNDSINNNLLTKPKIKFDVTSKDLLFVKEYGLSPNKMHTFLNQFIGKEFQEKAFIEAFENECPVPSRETFWKNLVSCQALVNEENYVFIDMPELHVFHPSLCQRIKPKTTEQCSTFKRKIWLHQPEELGERYSKTLSFITQDDLAQFIGPEMYQLLEKKDILICNKLATFDPTKDPVLDNFDAISKEDFQNINICEETASLIIEDLINQQVIKEKVSTRPGLYYLLIDAENIEHVELTKHRLYTDEVRSLMTVCFAFRIALEKLKLMTIKTSENVTLPLPVKLHKRIVLDLKENEIIEKSYVEANADVSKTLDGLYPKCLNEDGYKKILLKKCCGMSCDPVIKMLIEKKWLVKSDEDSYYINPSIKTLVYPNPKQPRSHEMLPDHIERDTIIRTILNHLFLIEHLDHVKTILTSSRGQYLSFETPSFSLTPLIEKNLSSEIEIFALNGFDQLIVLEEKRWTFKTKCKILSIVTLGVCQIAVGAVLEALFPINTHGMLLIIGGMSDIIFAVSCCASGHCSFKNYLFQKVISTATLWYKPLSTFLSRSGFGNKLSGISFQSIKQGVSNVFRQFTADSTCSTVVKDCTVKILTAISQGVVYATADHVIESQIDKISLAITQVFNSKIDETIDDHSINHIMREMYSKLGPANSKTTLSVCFSKHVDKSKNKLSKSLSSTVALISTLIRQSWSQFKKFTNTANGTSFDVFLDIIKICENAVKGIKGCQLLFVSLEKQINDVLDLIECDLKISTTHVGNDWYSSPETIPEEELNLFVWSVCEDWKTEVKNLLSDCLNNTLLSPVLQFVTNYLVHSSSKFISKKSKTILRNEDIRKQNMSDYKRTQAKKKSKSKNQPFDESEYEECLLDLLKKRRNVVVFAEIMRKNISVDTNFLEMCCIILPKALKSEGVVLPNLEIIVGRNGTYQRFSTTDEKCKKQTIIIDLDSDVVTNVFKNKTLIKGGVDFILGKIVQDYPVLRGYPIDFLKSFVAEKIENAFGSQPNFSTMQFSSPQRVNNYFKINASVEHKVPYQHFHIYGRYVFNMNVDVDLRQEEQLTSLNLIEDQISKGFFSALDKINTHILKVQGHLRHFRLSLEDFEETNYEIVPQTNKAIKGNFHCFASHYKLVMPFVVNSFFGMCLEDFTISMSLISQVTDTKPYSPRGPHITYEITPCKNLKYLNKGTKGHVLINKECAGYSFSAKDCHTAGELILLTGFQLQKNCRVLMLGDSMFEGVSEVTSYPNFVALSYPNFNDMKPGFSNLSLFYKGIQCVVLIPRISASLSGMSVGEITTNIAEVVKKIRGQFGETKIAVCSIYKAKGATSVGKLTQTNKCLKLHCSRMNIDFLETNSFLSSDELDDKGMYLNKHGLNKILQHVL